MLIRATLDRFRTNRTVCTENVIAARWQSIEEDPNESISQRTVIGAVPIPFREDFAKEFLFAWLHNPAYIRIEVGRPSRGSHVW